MTHFSLVLSKKIILVGIKLFVQFRVYKELVKNICLLEIPSMLAPFFPGSYHKSLKIHTYKYITFELAKKNYT